MNEPVGDLAFHIELIAKAIDENFGDGYAKSHPELICALVNSYAILTLADAVRNHS